MTYKILRIWEDDYGCEGVPDGEEPFCTVIASDENGAEVSLRLAESFLDEKGLNVGDVFEI